MKDLLTPLAKSVLVPLGLMEAASATDEAIKKNGSGMTSLTISNEELEYIIKIIYHKKPRKESGSLIKGISERIKNEGKENKNKKEAKKYYQNKPRFNHVYWRNDLPKVKDEVYVVNLDEYKSIGNHWIALYVNADNVIYFGSFGGEHVLVNK